jgi:uncharacterized alpha-E superfamily protein
MLSRVAERLYWLGRYLSRCENTARLITTHGNLLLDLPRRVEIGWGILTQILGSEALFRQRYRTTEEENVMRYLLSDPENYGSLLANLAMARENLRTTREIMPSEAWEQLNDLYMATRSALTADVSRRSRAAVLTTLIRATERIWGIAEMNLRHDAAYHFLTLGRAVEQADMTTRIMDGAVVSLMKSEALNLHEFRAILWMSVLRALSSYQSYRQQVGNAVTGVDVLLFLLRDNAFPRSVAHSLGQISAISALLPRGDLLCDQVGHLERGLATMDTAALHERAIHQVMDDIQVHIADLHGLVGETWFSH